MLDFGLFIFTGTRDKDAVLPYCLILLFFLIRTLYIKGSAKYVLFST